MLELGDASLRGTAKVRPSFRPTSPAYFRRLFRSRGRTTATIMFPKQSRIARTIFSSRSRRFRIDHQESKTRASSSSILTSRRVLRLVRRSNRPSDESIAKTLTKANRRLSRDETSKVAKRSNILEECLRRDHRAAVAPSRTPSR